MANTDKDKYEELKRQHAQAIESLRGLYEENPELEAEAPEGLPDLLRPEEHADDPVLEPPSTDFMAEDDAAVESEASAAPSPQRERLAEDDEAFLSPKTRVFLRENRQMWQRKARLGKEGPKQMDPPAPPEGGGMNLDDAEDPVETSGVRDPERGDIRAMADLAFSMQEYNRNLIELLHEMQDMFLDATSDIESMRARFARMR